MENKLSSWETKCPVCGTFTEVAYVRRGESVYSMTWTQEGPTKPKRKWVKVGYYCKKCETIVRDSKGKPKTEFST